MLQKLKNYSLLLMISWILISCDKPRFDYATQALDEKQQTITFLDKQDKILVFNYWATWCPNCIAEIPVLNDIQAQYANKIYIVGVNLQNLKSKELQAKIKELKINYKIITSDMSASLHIEPPAAYPATVFVAPSGKILKVHYGKLTKKLVEDLLV